MADSSRPDLPDGTADVWWARKLDASDRHAGLLDDTERQRLERYRSEEDRQRFLTGCALAKTVLARYTGQPAAGSASTGPAGSAAGHTASRC